MATTTIGGILETILVLAIVAEVSAAAYVYRDQIAEIIRSYTTNTQVQEVVPLPDAASPVPVIVDALEITETPMLTPTASATPVLTIVVNNQNSGNDQANSTPDPNGNNGNHFGQTREPPGNNNGDDEKDKGKDK